MLKQLVFYETVAWDNKRDRPTFGVIPIKEVADHYETTPETVQEFFEAWINEGMPKYFEYAIDFFYTLRRNEKRAIYLGLHYDPKVFYCDGSIKTLVQWGKDPKNTRWSEKQTISFGLEPILSINTHEERSS